MIIYFIVSAIARIFMPQDAILVNQKLNGYWLVIENYQSGSQLDDSLYVIKFGKCSSKERKQKECTYSWSVIDSGSVVEKKLSKSVKRNWVPDITKTYWVEKKRNKETKRTVIHIEDFSEASIHLLKKELGFYRNDSLVIKLRKLK